MIELTLHPALTRTMTLTQVFLHQKIIIQIIFIMITLRTKTESTVLGTEQRRVSALKN